MATQRRNALGRGLDALLSMEEVKTEGSSSINEIELSKISVNPNQPRREFDETALEELADSIREIGIIQPRNILYCLDVIYSLEFQVMDRHNCLDTPIKLTACKAFMQIYRNQTCLPIMTMDDIRLKPN